MSSLHSSHTGGPRKPPGPVHSPWASAPAPGQSGPRRGGQWEGGSLAPEGHHPGLPWLSHTPRCLICRLSTEEVG